MTPFRARIREIVIEEMERAPLDDTSAIAQTCALRAIEELLAREPSEGMISLICPRIKNSPEQCANCPESISTAYGPGTQSCRLLAIELFKTMTAQLWKEVKGE